MKTRVTRSTYDLSLSMFATLVTAIVLWLIYGIVKSELPPIAANGTTLVFAATILYFKLRYG